MAITLVIIMRHNNNNNMKNELPSTVTQLPLLEEIFAKRIQITYISKHTEI